MKPNKVVLALIISLCFMLPMGDAGYCAPIGIEATEINSSSLDDSIDEAIQNSTQEIKTPHVEDLKVMTPNSNKEVKNEVLKDTNNNLKYTIKKFLCAMAGVLISSVIIFLILTVMNKIHSMKGKGFPIKEDDEPLNTETISAPAGENDALKIFFEKTR